MSKLTMNIGRSNKMTPETLIKLINKTIRTINTSIGKIDIRKKYTTFEVDNKMKDIILLKMKDIRHGRTKIVISNDNQSIFSSSINKKKKPKKRRRKGNY